MGALTRLARSLRRGLRPATRRRQLAIAGWALLVAAWRVRRWRFARLADSLGRLGTGPALPLPAAPDAAPPAAVAEVRAAIAAWAYAWPWPPTCLMQAVAARELLARQGYSGSVVFGVRASAGQPRSQGQPLVGAHAWLVCGQTIVTGAGEAAAHQAIARYDFGDGPRAA